MRVNYEIKEHIATLSTDKQGFTKELNLISWNGEDAKLDIRRFPKDKSYVCKGITLTADEAANLFIALDAYL